MFPHPSSSCRVLHEALFSGTWLGGEGECFLPSCCALGKDAEHYSGRLSSFLEHELSRLLTGGPQRPQDRGRRRTEQVGGAAGAGRRCWVGGGPAAGEGPEPLPLTGAGTAQLGLGGAVSANGSVARAEPPRLPASGQPEGAAALRLARTRGCRRAWRVGAGESLASPVSDRASLSETGTRAVCALLGEGLEPRRTWSSFELCVVFSNQSAKICPESSDTKSPSNPARGYRGTRFVTVGFRLPGSFMMHQIS